MATQEDPFDRYRKKYAPKPPFDPEGSGYDFASAERAGLTADSTEHWPSRVPEGPNAGLLLKGRGHPTWDKTLAAEDSLGNSVMQGPDKRWYSYAPGEKPPWSTSEDEDPFDAYRKKYAPQAPQTPETGSLLRWIGRGIADVGRQGHEAGLDFLMRAGETPLELTGAVAEFALGDTEPRTVLGRGVQRVGEVARDLAQASEEERFLRREVHAPTTGAGTVAAILSPFVYEGISYAVGGETIRGAAGPALTKAAPRVASALGVGRKLSGLRGAATEAAKDVATFGSLDVLSTVPSGEETSAAMAAHFTSPEMREEYKQATGVLGPVLRALGESEWTANAHERLKEIADDPIQRGLFEVEVGFGFDTALRVLHGLGLLGRAAARKARGPTAQAGPSPRITEPGPARQGYREAVHETVGARLEGREPQAPRRAVSLEPGTGLNFLGRRPRPAPEVPSRLRGVLRSPNTALGAAGAGVGAWVDEEDRARGALLGATIGAGGRPAARYLRGLDRRGAIEWGPFGGPTGNWYSRLEESAKAVKMKRGPIDQWEAALQAVPGGVSEDELGSVPWRQRLRKMWSEKVAAGEAPANKRPTYTREEVMEAIGRGYDLRERRYEGWKAEPFEDVPSIRGVAERRSSLQQRSREETNARSRMGSRAQDLIRQRVDQIPEAGLADAFRNVVNQTLPPEMAESSLRATEGFSAADYRTALRNRIESAHLNTLLDYRYGVIPEPGSFQGFHQAGLDTAHPALAGLGDRLDAMRLVGQQSVDRQLRIEEEEGQLPVGSVVQTHTPHPGYMLSGGEQPRMLTAYMPPITEFENPAGRPFTVPIHHDEGEDPLSHLRGSTRMDSEVGRYFWVDEIQNDLAQRGGGVLRKRAKERSKDELWRDDLPMDSREAMRTRYNEALKELKQEYGEDPGFYPRFVDPELSRRKAEAEKEVERLQLERDRLVSRIKGGGTSDYFQRKSAVKVDQAFQYDTPPSPPGFGTVIYENYDRPQLDALNIVKEQLTTATARLADIDSKLSGGPLAKYPYPPMKRPEIWMRTMVGRAVQEAMDQGLDHVVFINGTQSALRYNIGDSFEWVEWDADNGVLRGQSRQDGRIVEHSIEDSDLENYVGEDLAEELREAVQSNGGGFDVGEYKPEFEEDAANYQELQERLNELEYNWEDYEDVVDRRDLDKAEAKVESLREAQDELDPDAGDYDERWDELDHQITEAEWEVETQREYFDDEVAEVAAEARWQIEQDMEEIADRWGGDMDNPEDAWITGGTGVGRIERANMPDPRKAHRAIYDEMLPPLVRDVVRELGGNPKTDVFRREFPDVLEAKEHQGRNEPMGDQLVLRITPEMAERYRTKGLRLGRAEPGLVHGMARAGAGAAVGAAVGASGATEEEGRLRGAIGGGLVGLAAGAGAPAAARRLRGLGESGFAQPFGGQEGAFYSRLKRAVEKGPNQAPLSQWKGYLRNAGDLGKTELDWAALEQTAPLEDIWSEDFRKAGDDPVLTKEEMRNWAQQQGFGALQEETTGLWHSEVPPAAREPRKRFFEASEKIEALRQERSQADHAVYEKISDLANAEDLVSLSRRLRGVGMPVPDEGFYLRGDLSRFVADRAHEMDEESFRTLVGELSTDYMLTGLAEPLQRYRAAMNQVSQARTEAEARARDVRRAGGTTNKNKTRYSSDSYNLPGTTNRRELGLVVPANQVKRQGNLDFYRSSHFVDWENLNAHVRVSDYTSPTGERVLVVEELQSDWVAETRTKGTAKRWRTSHEERVALDRAEALQKQRADEVSALESRWGNPRTGLSHRGYHSMHGPSGNYDAPQYEAATLARELHQEATAGVHRAREAALGSGTMPQPPLQKVDDWVGILLRRALTEAEAGGYDKVIFLNGAQSADRYYKHNYFWDGWLEYDPNDEILHGKTSKGRMVHETVPPGELSEWVGAETATEIRKNIVERDWDSDWDYQQDRARVAELQEQREQLAPRVTAARFRLKEQQRGIGRGQLDLVTPEAELRGMLAEAENNYTALADQLQNLDQEIAELTSRYGDDIENPEVRYEITYLGGEDFQEVVKRAAEETGKPPVTGHYGLYGPKLWDENDNPGAVPNILRKEAKKLGATDADMGLADQGFRPHGDWRDEELAGNWELRLTPAVKEAIRGGQRLGAVEPALLKGLARGGVGALAGAAVGASTATGEESKGLRAIGGGLLGLAAASGAPGALAKASVRSLDAEPFLRRLFTSRGNLPAKTYERWVKSQGWVGAEMTEIRNLQRDFSRAAQEAYGTTTLDAAELEKLDDALKDPAKLAALPDPMRSAVQAMRNHTDALSRRMIASGVVDGPLVAKVTENLGTYATRSYQAWDDPDWANTVRKKHPELINYAVGWIRSELTARGKTMSDEEVDGLVDTLLDRRDDASPLHFLASGKLGSKDLSILTKRKDIAEPIRRLMGEYRDPMTNYARSVTKMAHLIANHEFLTEVRAQGLGTFLHEEPVVRDGVRYTKAIAAEGSKTMAPLNGLYTTPEIRRAFEEALAPEQSPEWLRQILRLNAAVKYAKTVGSVQTHVRNVLGNVGFAVMNGHWRVWKAKDALRTTAANLGIGDDALWREEYKRLQRLNVVDESARADELRDAVQDTMKRRFDEVSPAATLTEKAVRTATQAYRAEDDVWKVFAFYNERERYSKALKGESVEEVEKRAAEIVRNTYPTYSKVPLAFKKLRKFPLVGTFISFPAEVFRTTFHTLKLAQEELADPRLRKIGAQRLAGIAAAATGVYGTSLASRYLAGVTAEEEDDMRRFLPSWTENSNLVFLGRDKDGNVRYIDLSYSDPHSYLRTPVNAMLRGDDWVPALQNAVGQMLSPFLSEEIMAQHMLDVSRNKEKESGRPIYNPEDDAVGRFNSILGHLVDAVEPGTWSSFERIAQGLEGETTLYGTARDPLIEAAAMATGFRITKLDLKQAMGYRARELYRRRTNAHDIVGDVARRRGSVDDKELRKGFEGTEGARQSVFADAHRDAWAAVRLGLAEEEVTDLLQAAGFSDADAFDIVDGVYEPWGPSSTFLRNMETSVRAQGTNELGDKAADELARRKDRLWEYSDSAAMVPGRLRGFAPQGR